MVLLQLFPPAIFVNTWRAPNPDSKYRFELDQETQREISGLLIFLKSWN